MAVEAWNQVVDVHTIDNTHCEMCENWGSQASGPHTVCGLMLTEWVTWHVELPVLFKFLLFMFVLYLFILLFIYLWACIFEFTEVKCAYVVTPLYFGCLTFPPFPCGPLPHVRYTHLPRCVIQEPVNHAWIVSLLLLSFSFIVLKILGALHFP
jgi:hypothetical protein